jgi:hypothetical protein
MTSSWLLAAALPIIWWTGELQTAPRVREAGLATFCVDAASVAEWKKIEPRAQPCSVDGRQRLVTPGVDLKVNVASATRSPWINTNAWRFRRDPAGAYFYENPGRSCALALAEAFGYGVKAAIRTPDELPRSAAMLRFLATVEPHAGKPVADVSFVDDGSSGAGEAMNSLTRRNILFRRLEPAEPRSGRVVAIGSPEFPAKPLSNPSEFAYQVRRWLKDENRTLRIYGSENVLAYATEAGGAVRLHLLNYTGNAVEGLRISIKGQFKAVALKIFDVGDAKPEDLSIGAETTEFSIASLDE